MREFLEKLQEDQRRMRKYLRSHALHFKRMGDVLAGVRMGGGRLFVIAEPPLEGVSRVVAEEYFAHLPALPVYLDKPRPASVDDESGPPATLREAGARQAARHFHKGDALLAFLHSGEDRETRMVLESARAKRVKVLIVGGLGAKSAHTKRISKVLLTLPTRGIKTICESCFTCSRILARVSRAAYRGAEVEEARLVQTACETCNERVFFEEHQRGKKAVCPLCEAKMRVPKDSGRRAVETDSAPQPPSRKKRSRKLKPSVLELPTLNADDLEDASPADEPLPVLETVDDDSSRPVELEDPELPTSAEGPSFGSDIIVGSDVVSATPMDDEPRAPVTATTASADPFALEDAFLADLEMPKPNSSTSSASSSSSDLPGSSASRRVSARYTAGQCRLRYGRGGYPDETGPEHELVSLDVGGLVFVLNPEDEASTTLQKGDELWLRLEIPAFLEPLYVRGSLQEITGTAGAGGDGARAELSFQDVDPAVRRKLQRAAQNLGAPA